MKTVIGPLESCAMRNFIINTEGLAKSKGIPLFFLVCSTFSESKESYTVTKQVLVKRPGFPIIVHRNYIISDQGANERLMTDMKTVRRKLIVSLRKNIMTGGKENKMV